MKQGEACQARLAPLNCPLCRRFSDAASARHNSWKQLLPRLCRARPQCRRRMVSSDRIRPTCPDTRHAPLPFLERVSADSTATSLLEFEQLSCS